MRVCLPLPPLSFDYSVSHISFYSPFSLCLSSSLIRTEARSPACRAHIRAVAQVQRVQAQLAVRADYAAASSFDEHILIYFLLLHYFLSIHQISLIAAMHSYLLTATHGKCYMRKRAYSWQRAACAVGAAVAIPFAFAALFADFHISRKRC